MNEEKLTQEEIQKILEEHQRWLESGGEEGERADFSRKNLREVNLRGVNLERANLERANLERATLWGANLRGANLWEVNLERANLERANLWGATLWGANLRGANLRGANLWGANLERVNLVGANLLEANLERANLERANLVGANLEGVNLERTSGITRAITDAAVLENNLRQHEQAIYQLQQQLQAAQNNHEQVEELQKELQEAQTGKQQIEAQLQQLQEQNEKLKGELNSRIGEAKKSLENALKNTTNQIKKNVELAEEFGKIAKVVLALVAVAIFLIPLYAIWRLEQFPKESWHMVFYTFPVIAMILIATTLLRHQKALLNEVRHFSMMKHQIELYSGLLEASQHAAASMGDPEQADRYVQETFTQIRNRLLSAQAQEHHQAADGREDDTASDKIVNLLDKIADLANKKPS